MSGGNVPYHLRVNKSVDRAVFIDLLHRLSRATRQPVSAYRYIGFAGPFCEDFKLVHSGLGITNFVSLELDEGVLQRQKWNAPFKGIDFRHERSSFFIGRFEPEKPSILWLDYAQQKALSAQLGEVQSLVARLGDFDVLKITFGATLKSLGPLDDSLKRLAEAKQRVANYVSDTDVLDDDVEANGYPKLVLKAAEISIKRGMVGRTTSQFQLLTCFSYSDGEHTMLTLTGIVLPKAEAKAVLINTEISKWALSKTKWGVDRTTPIHINLPLLSIQERLAINKKNKGTGRSKRTTIGLPFNVAKGGTSQSVAAIRSYLIFAKYTPFFTRAVL